MSRTKSPLFAFSVLALLLMIGLAAPVLAKAQSLVEVNFRTPRALHKEYHHSLNGISNQSITPKSKNLQKQGNYTNSLTLFVWESDKALLMTDESIQIFSTAGLMMAEPSPEDYLALTRMNSKCHIEQKTGYYCVQFSFPITVSGSNLIILSKNPNLCFIMLLN